MSEERVAVLRMLSEGKISVEEAEKLLNALGESSDKDSGGDERGHRGRQTHGRHRGRRDTADLGELVGEIGEEVRRAVGSVQTSEIGRVVRREIDKAVHSVQSMDVGRMVNEVVDQVKDAVNDAVEQSGSKGEVLEEQDWTLDGAGLLAVHANTDNGNIRYVAGSGSRVRVVAKKKIKAPSREEAEVFARQVQVTAVREGDIVRIYKEHIKPPKGFGVEVSYEVTGPAEADLELRTVNGNVEVQGCEASVQGQSTNGNLKVEGARGQVQLRTQNGNISARVDELRHEALFTNTNGSIFARIEAGCAPMTATSTNGNVELSLHGDFAAKVDARTTNGSVESGLQLSRVDLSKRTQLVGQLGVDSEVEVRLHTLNGNVVIKPLEQEQTD
ncbi:MAG: hypothetical protein ACI906_001020 [Candidatus Latescibacterota bacterium]|jgi:hypothetical protein